MRIIPVILIGLAALLQCVAIFQSTGRALADYPNPNLDPLACGRLNVPRSSVCDPDKLLSNDDKNLIEGYINKIDQAQVAVAVLDKMNMKGLSTSDIDTASERFARGLHDKWGVGDAEKQNGILLFFSISDRAVYISTGSGVQNILTYSTLQGLISNMKPALRRKKYGTAVADCLIQIDLLLSGKAHSSIFAAYGNTAAPSEEGIWEFGAAFTLFLSIIGLAVFCKIRDDNRLRNYQRGRDMINNLMTAVDPADPPPQGPQSPHESHPSHPTTASTQPKPQYLSSSCPICLEDFPKKEDERDKKDEDAPVSTAPPDPQRAAMSLQCGHIFCKGCLETFLRSVEGNNCPICRAPVDPSLGGGAGSRSQSQPASSRPRGFNPFSSRVRTLDTQRLRQDYDSYWTSRSNVGGGAAIGTQSSTQTYTSTETLQDPHVPNPSPSPQFDSFSRHSPEIRFRLHRMRSLYPDIMSLELLRSMNLAMDRGSIYDVRNQLDLRSRELQRMVEDIRKASEMSARNNGMRGSSYSFGGGRSSGGGGGRW